MLKCLKSTLVKGLESESIIKDGDLVIVYLKHDEMKAVTIDSKKQYSCKFGNFAQKDWVGKSFGSKVCSLKNKGFVYLLAPSPELWRVVLRHRTQILYTADISLILHNLELRPGSIVLETGTGSGGLTHSLVQAVAPKGRVHTFEFHKERCEEAAKEFAANSVEEFVSLELRNTEQEGFPPELHNKADAVFLDLPGPHKVVQSASDCLKENGNFCSFSPCIEQVTRTCAALSKTGFFNITTVECLLRHFMSFRSTPLTDFLTIPQGKKRKLDERDGGSNARAQRDRTSGLEVSVQQLPQARGHTGYLTFAKKIAL